MKKSEKGSTTLITFATVMFILIVVGTILTMVMSKQKSQLVETKRLQEAYDGDMAEIYTEITNNETE